MVKVLTEPEASEYIVALLREKGPMTTKQIEILARKQGKRCPDETVLFLSKMRMRKIINGEISQEKRGWVWWV